MQQVQSLLIQMMVENQKKKKGVYAITLELKGSNSF